MPSSQCPDEQGFRLRERANDAVEEFLAGNANPNVKASCVLPLSFERVETLRVHVVGSGDISLDSPDQGSELERLTFQTFDSLFPFGAFHSP